MKRSLALALAALISSTAHGAAAEEATPGNLRISGSSSGCPTPRQLAAELRSLFPTLAFELTAADSPGGVRITDEGSDFVVTVDDQSRKFDDPQRECAERARLAAVFVALALDPLHVPEAERVRESTPPSTSPARRTRLRQARFDLELGPLLWVAPFAESDNVPRAGGLGARFGFGATLGFSLGLAGFLPASLQYESADARAIWVPVDIALRARTRLSSWELGGEIGPLAALLSLRGEAVADARSAARVELGARLGASLRYFAAPNNAVFLGVQWVVFPRPYELELEGVGRVGRTPSQWFGLAIGTVIDWEQ